MFKNYENFLKLLTPKLEQFFDAQKDYMFCKSGCSLCCKTGCYPSSKIEVDYLKKGLELVDTATRDAVLANIVHLKEKRKLEGGDRNWLYDCPFLVDEKCSVYEHRMVVCRTFGLPYFKEDGSLIIPSCVDHGLNYSNVYDFENSCLCPEKIKEAGFKQEPLAYNLSSKFLYNCEFAKVSNLDFGEQKALLDWLD